MTSIYRPPSSSRSLPPIPEALDRGRPKARLNTDPDVYANLRNSTGISLPPIRPTRGSKDETLPGISSIIDQSEYEHRGRRMSEAYPASPRDWDRVHSPSVWTRVDSTDGSRPSSPDLSSSTSSLSSILQDRSECASPARFLASRLPPHSAFELSDLRTSLPSHEPRRSRTPVFRSPRSTPLPLSRPMSPTVQLSPHLRPLTRRLRSLAVNEDRASVKSEPDTDSVPSSPRSKSIDISEKDSPEPPMRDEQMACTPTQPDPNLPAPWMDTESTTPTNRHSPLVNSPSPASEEDSKSGILGTESETEDEGLSYAERRARRKAANEGPIDASTVRTRGGLDWLMSPGLSTPITEIVQLQQQAERFGFKLQPDPERQATSTQSQLLYQMAERQSYIERLQREQEEAAATYQARIGIVPPSQPTWTPSIDQSFGGLPMPELAPPLLPASIFPQQQAPSFIPEPLSDLDYAFGGAATGLTSDQYLGTPGLTAASSATSASSPSESFYLSSPPPSNVSHIMPPRFNQEMAYKAQDPFKADTMGFKAQDMQMGFKPQDMGFKVHDHLGFKSQDAIAAFVDDEPGPSTSVMTTSGSGTHKCHSCGKTFRRPSGLKDHMNIHSGEKPYCCPLDTCRKGFATRSNMIRHHNKTHPSRPKIGGVADIGTDVEDMVDIADPTSPAESSQSRFRVVQQNGKDGVGPVRGTKERRTMRKHTVSGVAPTMG